MKSSRPILVTGSHRSGSTWMGKMLSLPENVRYIHEPFNIRLEEYKDAMPFQYWFTHVGSHNESLYSPYVEQILGDGSKDDQRQLLKDPIALFSAEWMSQRFMADVVVMIRHPAAFCASILKKQWAFNFKHFLNQPELIDGYLAPYKQEIQDFSFNQKPLIDQAILLWNCFHTVIQVYQARHPDWIYIKHEDVSLNPVTTIRDIYSQLNLEFSDSVGEKINKSTGSHNPAEAFGVGGATFNRDSKKNIKNYLSRLTESEILHIRKKTERVWRGFYSDQDW